MLYILKLVCLHWKSGHVIHFKISNAYFIKTDKNGYVVILKLVCLLQKYGKNGYVVHIKSSMFTTERRKKPGLFTVSKPRYITAVKPCRYKPRFFRTITVCH